MAVLPIRLYPDPVLRERASEVAVVDDAVRQLANNLFETMRAAPNGAGLAAPQIGVLRRIFVYEVEGAEGTLINPEILERRGEDTKEEGCLSIPELYFPVVRAAKIVVTGLNATGDRVRYEAEDWHARVIQHEIDHLDGVVFIDRLEPDLNREARRVLRERELSGRTPEASRASL